MPLRTEYSCRLRDPEEFQKKSFRRISSGDVDLIIARPHGMKKTRAQAIRYPRELWNEKDAKRSCKKRKGKFEPVNKLGQIPPFLLKKKRKAKTKPRPSWSTEGLRLYESRDSESRRPLPPDAQNIQDLSFNSDQFTCYGKPTGRGFRAYCRRK